MSSRSPVRRRRRDSPRDERSSRRRHGDYSSRRDRDAPRRRRDESSRSPGRDRRSRSESPPRRRRRRSRSSGRRDKRRSRRSLSTSSGSDGVYATEGHRRRDSRRRDERDGRRRSGGGGGYEDQLKDKIQKLYKEYCDVYKMIREESSQIRMHSTMRYAFKKLREEDKGDVRALRDLRESDSPIDMLKCFCSEAKEIRQKLNKKYRAHFFKKSTERGDSDRYSRSSEPYRDDERRESRRRYDRQHRSRSSYDHDREPRERRDRGRSSRRRR